MWIARTFYMHEPRACNPVCSPVPVAELFEKSLLRPQPGENCMVRVLHLVSYPPADFIVAGLEVHDSFVQPVFRCTAPYQDQNKYDPGELHCVTRRSSTSFSPSFHFLQSLSSHLLPPTYPLLSPSLPRIFLPSFLSQPHTQFTLRVSFSLPCFALVPP